MGTKNTQDQQERLRGVGCADGLCISGKTGMGIFDGSIHEVTHRAKVEGESDEGWSTAEAASGDRLLLQIYGRRGDEARISLTAQQAWALKIRLEYASLELTRRANSPPLCQQAQRPGWARARNETRAQQPGSLERVVSGRQNCKTI